MRTDNYKDFCKLLPKDFHVKLQQDFKVSTEIAFHIQREGTKSLDKMSDEEYNTLLQKTKVIIDEFDFESQCKTKFVMKEYVPKELETKIQKSLWNDMSPDLYLVFWYHIQLPSNRCDLYH